MRRTVIAVVAITALLSIADRTYAQQQAGNARKNPNQTHDQGFDDEKTPPGQAVKGPGDQNVAQVTVKVLADGVAVAELDESFEAALVVTVGSDGTRTFTEVKGGLPVAADVVKTNPTPIPAAPVLEEK